MAKISPKPGPLHIKYRFGIKADIPAVVSIEQQSFQEPWSAEQFEHLMGTEEHFLGVAVSNKHIVGYLAWRVEERSLEILTIAVDPVCRRCGVGSQMISAMISKLQRKARSKLTITCREDNLSAQLFLRAQGLRWVRTSRGLFGAPEYRDGYVFEYILPLDDQGAPGDEEPSGSDPLWKF